MLSLRPAPRVQARSTRRRIVTVVAVLLAALVPVATAAEQAQEGPPRSTREKRTEVRRRQGEIRVEVDVLKAHNTEVQAALTRIEANVAAQAAALEEAKRAAAVAAQEVVEAETAVAAAQGRIAELDMATDEFVIDAYVNPPSDNAFDAFSAENISDATVKQVLLDIQADSDADVFDQLREAHEDLDLERANKELVAAEAQQKQLTAEQALAQLEAARAQQAAFAAQAEQALDRKLVESANLAELDAQLSRQIAAEQAELARQLAEARRAAGGGAEDASGPGTLTPAPGGLATASCAGGGGITVAGDLAASLRGLLDEAGADRIPLCGWGYRSGQRQIELRQAHCGRSDYAVWRMPAWQCNPPTARPGRSMHEQGLAVDFTCGGGGIGTRSNQCYRWLAANAAGYGLYNLPSEPWHWSTNGN